MRHDTNPANTPPLRQDTARQDAARTGRGVDVTEVGNPEATVQAERDAGSDDAGHGVLTASGVGTVRAAGGVASWQEIKSRFVDDPGGALAEAEELVRRAVDERVRALQDEATSVCARDRGEDDASTETLRTRLLRYQQFCERLTADAVH